MRCGYVVCPFKCSSSLKSSGFWLAVNVFIVHQVERNCSESDSSNIFAFMHLFLPYLLNDSQTIRSMINFSKPLLCVTLICGDWSDCSISFKAAFVSAVLLWVIGETAIFTAPKTAPSGKEWICIFIQTNVKRPTSGRQYANVSCWRQHETAWDWF